MESGKWEKFIYPAIIAAAVWFLYRWYSYYVQNQAPKSSTPDPNATASAATTGTTPAATAPTGGITPPGSLGNFIFPPPPQNSPVYNLAGNTYGGSTIGGNTYGDITIGGAAAPPAKDTGCSGGCSGCNDPCSQQKTNFTDGRGCAKMPIPPPPIPFPNGNMPILNSVMAAYDEQQAARNNGMDVSPWAGGHFTPATSPLTPSVY